MFDLNAIVSAALNAAVAEAIKPLVERIAALENNPAQGVEPAPTNVTPAQIVDAMNNAEWLWEKLDNYVDAAIDNHCSNYDHDGYDRHISDDDIHFEGDLDDAVREAVGNLSFDISVS